MEDASTLEHIECKASLDRIVIKENNLNIDIELVICNGDHPHPPPPRARVPIHIQKAISDHVQQHPADTAFKAMSSKQLFGDSKCSVNSHPSLGNIDSVQRIVSKAKDSKFGNGFEGVYTFLFCFSPSLLV